MNRPLGVCSWSLRPGSPAELAEAVRAVGVDAVQLHLDPIRTCAWDEHDVVETLRRIGIRVLSGMMSTEGEDYSTLESIRRTGGLRPDEHWAANLAAAEANAALAARLGLPLVTLHAGFLPEQAGDPEGERMLQRVAAVADVFAARGVRLGLETGQETARSLAGVLDVLGHPNVFVNFDPANMILYGMGDPVEAMRLLRPRIAQVHLKDALPAERLGEWGTETPLGGGAVDWEAFFDEVDRLPGSVPLVIEREAGESRVEDARRAAEIARRRFAPVA